MYRQPLLAITLLLISGTAVNAQTASRETKLSHLQKLRAGGADTKRSTPLDRAYLDTYRVLSGDNQCSRFFGGSKSRQVLDELVVRVEDRTITDARIGIRMSGAVVINVEPKDGIEFRMFERAEINNLGAFYRSKPVPGGSLVPNVGSFQPNTREARVLMLLHEMAHLIKDRKGAWLIRDDVTDEQLSRSNTRIVESKCRQQIRSL